VEPRGDRGQVLSMICKRTYHNPGYILYCPREPSSQAV
jgi:hypothetical protein